MIGIIGRIAGALVSVTNVIEDVFFAILIKPLLLLLYGIVGGTQWVKVIDHFFDLLAESWPPIGPPVQPNDGQVEPQTQTGEKQTKRERRTLLNR